MNYTIYPTGKNTRYSSWNAVGEYYSKNINIEHFANEFDTLSPIYTYQKFLYTIMIYFYTIDKGTGRQTSRGIRSVDMIEATEDKISDLVFSNGTTDDRSKDFSITVVDLTSYIPRQPMLKLKYLINSGEIVQKIDFMYPSPTDPIMKEYTFEVKPFSQIEFIFDLENMK